MSRKTTNTDEKERPRQRQRQRLPCPCASFSSSTQVISALSCDTEAQKMIEWIEGDVFIDQDEDNGTTGDGNSRGENKFQKVPLTSYRMMCKHSMGGYGSNGNGNDKGGSGGRCPNRVGAAYCILNAIRDGCRDFLEDPHPNPPPSSTDSNGKGKTAGVQHQLGKINSHSKILTAPAPELANNKAKKVVISYEEAFPTISQSSSKAKNQTTTPNILKPRKKKIVKSGMRGLKVGQHIPEHVPVAGPVPAAAVGPVPDLCRKGKSNGVTSIGNNIGNRVLNANTKTKGYAKEPGTPTKAMAVKRRIRPTPAGPISPSQQPSSSSPWASSIATTVEKQQNSSNTRSFSSSSSSFHNDPMNRVMSMSCRIDSPPIWGAEKISNTFHQQPTTTISATNTTTSIRIGSRENVVKQQRVIARTTKTGKIDDDAATIPKGLETLLKYTKIIYSTIIKRRLVPSVSLELQLLIRLISLQDNDIQNEKNDLDITNTNTGMIHPSKEVLGGGGSLKGLFQNASICRIFAFQVLEELKLILVNLDKDILQSLLNLSTIVERMSGIAKDIQASLDARRQALLSEGNHGMVVVNGVDDGLATGVMSGKSTIITMPFQERRDSRHNYRSRDLTSLYNNREQSRDAFLFQLRAFQQMRGTVLNPSQIQNSLDAIKESSRQMMQALIPTNIGWFSELFTDLLLQIGLVPMQETDADILKNVSDKDKLQKLHSRFTSKVAQKNKSSKPLVLRDRNEASGPSPDEFFTGHQEFFYLFIRAVDSHSFNMHLQKRIVHIILSSSALTETRGIEQRIAELQLLSRFLGLIVFSPNWNMYQNYEVYQHQLYFTPVIPINAIIEEGYKEGKLLVTIPWILSFLRMITWDKTSIQHSYYRESFSMLRSIHKNIIFTVKEDGYDPLVTNMAILGFQLDTFFAEVVGLNQIELFCEYSLPRPPHQDGRNLDMIPIGFSKTFILSSSSHVDDLYKLVTELSINGKIRSSGGASKKLKPYFLSNNTSGNPITQGNPERDPLVFGKLQLLLNESPTISKAKNICVDTFFHQHKHLQQLCEFIVDFGIENELSKRFSRDCIEPSVINIFIQRVPKGTAIPDPIDIDWYLSTLQAIEKDATLIADTYMRQSLTPYIRTAINALMPTDVDPKIKSIATTLTINHALRKGEALSSSIVRSEAKKVIDSQLNPHCKELKTKYMNGRTVSFGQKLIVRMEKLAHHLEQITNAFESDELNAVIDEIQDHARKKSDEKLLFFDSTSISAVHSLVTALLSAATKWMVRNENNGHKYSRNLKDVVRVSIAVGQAGFSFDELTSLGLLICRPNYLKALLNDDCLQSKELLESCVASNVVTNEDLENGLLDLLEGHKISQKISKFVILLVEENRANDF